MLCSHPNFPNIRFDIRVCFVHDTPISPCLDVLYKPKAPDHNPCTHIPWCFFCLKYMCLYAWRVWTPSFVLVVNHTRGLYHMHWVEYQQNTMFQVHLPMRLRIVRKERGCTKVRGNHMVHSVQDWLCQYHTPYHRVYRYWVQVLSVVEWYLLKQGYNSVRRYHTLLRALVDKLPLVCPRTPCTSNQPQDKKCNRKLRIVLAQRGMTYQEANGVLYQT